MENRKLAAAFAALLALTPAWVSAQPVPAQQGETAEEGGRIVGGKEAPAGTAPWQAEIYSTYVYTDADVAKDKTLKAGDAKKYYLDTKSGSERIHRCGGAYIGDMWVLTAAHCIEDDMLTSRRVRLGTQNLESGGATYAIDRVVVHKGYGSDATHSNDIALLHIRADAKTGMTGLPPSVRAIRILGEQSGDRPITPADQVKVTGWGRTSAKTAGGGELAANGQVNHSSAVLKELALSVLPAATCATAAPYANVKFDTVVCAKSSKEGEDSCNGDSGGPLTRAQGKERVLVGLVSWGRGCALPNMPGIYTRAPAYLDWIAAAKRGAQPGKLLRL